MDFNLSEKEKSEQIINSIFKDELNQTDDIQETFLQLLHKVAFQYNGTDDFLEFILKFTSGELRRTLETASAIISKHRETPSKLMKYIDTLQGERLIYLYLTIISEIVYYDYRKALDYISNFTINPNIIKSCISLYALAKGMKFINIETKKKANVMLASYNYAKSHIEVGFDFNSNYENASFYDQRGVDYECILNYGYDFRMFNRSEEIAYINEYCSNLLLKKLNISKKNLKKDFIKIDKADELHNLFLSLRRGNDGKSIKL